MRVVISAAVLALLPCLIARGVAQDPKTQSDPKREYKKLTTDYKKVYQEWVVAVRKAMTDRKAGQPVQAVGMEPPTGEYVKRAMAAAEKYSGTDDAVMFLAWVIRSASNERTALQNAFDIVMAEHLESEGMLYVLPYVGNAERLAGKERIAALLDGVIESSPHDAVKGLAYYHRGRRALAGEPDEAGREAVRVDLRKAAALAGEGDRLKSWAEGTLFEMDHLQVGLTAPEIEAPDLEGVSFKLSDYRGKVVMLDFWGDW